MSDLSTISLDETIHACNGLGLKRLVRASLTWLEQNHEHVNSLNVFPVPDGDTGTNMLLTMRSAYNEIENSDSEHVGQVAGLLSNGALMGSRGNSGVILSQLWRGFARGLQDDQTLTVEGFARGLEQASRMAYRAVQTPVEGTMLTVSREMAEAAADYESDDLRDLLQYLVTVCRESVKRTPDLLPVLKDAGVVDSGGMGMMYIFEGMLRYLNNLPVEADGETVHAAHDQHGEPEYDPEFPYDVQFLIRGEKLDVDRIRQDIEAMGDSGVIVGDPTLVKVHIHVANPGDPIGYGAQHGQLMDVVVENMYLQYLDFLRDRPIGDVPMGVNSHKPTIEEGSIATVVIAPSTGFEEIFYSLGAGAVIHGGQTMNPSTKDILEAVESLPTDRIIVLPNNKNILMAAEQASAQANGRTVCVVPTVTVPQGVAAQLALDPRGELDDVLLTMQDMASLVETGEVTTATRNATINDVQVAEGEIIGLHNGQLIITGSDTDGVVLDLLDRMGATDLELITLYYGETVTQQDALELLDTLRERYPEHEIELQHGGQPHYHYIISAE
ncbi:MAG: DAK2 domain-containing protein [Chloroflexi bacterium]|nr:DAK2 domain-containing protein [Chloroflexota bacterium]